MNRRVSDSGIADAPFIKKMRRPVREMPAAELMSRAEYLASVYTKLRALVAQHSANNGLGFEQEFETLVDVGSTQLSKASAHAKNQHLNRFRNIAAFDHSRVVLEELNTDYINANWIPGHKRRHAYIASQGPVPDSFAHFWYMVWQSNAEIVVMVTREVEGGALKCHRYWPDPTSKPPTKSMVLERIKVDYLETRVDMTFTTRKFRLTKGKDSRVITQFSYEAWPDHGVPLTSKEFLEFREAIYNTSTSYDLPLVIHCSAGVGRTGTFMAIDRLLHCIDDDVMLDVHGVVEDLRNARNFMVQTFVQYAFVYRTVLDRLRTLLGEVGAEIQRRQEIERAAAEAEAVAQAAENAKLEAAARAQAEEKARADESARKEDLARQELLNQKTQETVAEAAKDEKEAAALEEQEIFEITGGKKPTKVMPIQSEEIEVAHLRWVEKNKVAPEAYDFDFVLTTTQSRIDALRARGYVMLLADADQKRAVVQAARDVKSKVENEAARKKAEAEAVIARQQQAAAEQEAARKKAEEKSAAQKKAAAFMKKLSTDKL